MNKQLQKECLRIWSFIVRSGKQCKRCGKTSDDIDFFDPHHIVHRQLPVRFLLTNGICLCRWCHIFATDFEQEFNAWFEEKHPGVLAGLTKIKSNLAYNFDLEETHRELLLVLERRNLAEAYQEYRMLKNSRKTS